jgi:hypothetical protein
VIELLIKLLAQGFYHYFEDTYNYFDTAVVAGSALDIAFQYSNLSKSSSGAITALRILRLSRVF